MEYAVEWLTEFLEDGPKEFSEIEKEAKRQEIKKPTLHRARGELKKNPLFSTYKKPGIQHGPWVWELKQDTL